MTALSVASRPQTTQSWIVVMVLFMAGGIIESLAFGHLGAFTPLYLHQMGISGTAVGRWTGVLASAGLILGIPLAPFWGVWADKYSRKLMIVRSAYIQAAILVITALSQSPWHLLVSRLLIGLMLGNTGIQMALQTSITPRQRTGFAISMIAAAPTLGTSLGPALGGLVIAHGDIRLLLMLDAVATVLVGLAMTIILRDPPSAQRTAERVGVLLRRSFKTILHSPVASRLFAGLFILTLGAQLTFPYVPLQIQALYHGQSADLALTIGWVLTATGIAGTLATPLWGQLGDRSGHVRVLMVAAVLTALMLGLQAFTPTLGTFAVVRVGYGATQIALSALTFAALATRMPESQRTVVLNLAFFPFYIAGVLAPSAAALLLPLGIPVLFALGGIVSLGALPFLVSAL